MAASCYFISLHSVHNLLTIWTNFLHDCFLY